MKKTYFISMIFLFLAFLNFEAQGQSQALTTQTREAEERKAKSDAEQEKKARAWVANLELADETKEKRVEQVISTHLKTIRDWHNEHPYTMVPAGINPLDGKPLSELDRQIIANSAMPKSVHENLMSGLRQDLNEDQVEAILDEYTIGKVDFTMKGYHAIVPDLTEEEEKTIRGLLEQAREQAVDFKNMDQISGIFEIYKTQAEQYLNSNGRNWRELYRAYVNKVQAAKAAEKTEK